MQYTSSENLSTVKISKKRMPVLRFLQEGSLQSMESVIPCPPGDPSLPEEILHEWDLRKEAFASCIRYLPYLFARTCFETVIGVARSTPGLFGELSGSTTSQAGTLLMKDNGCCYQIDRKEDGLTVCLFLFAGAELIAAFRQSSYQTRDGFLYINGDYDLELLPFLQDLVFVLNLLEFGPVQSRKIEPYQTLQSSLIHYVNKTPFSIELVTSVKLMKMAGQYYRERASQSSSSDHSPADINSSEGFKTPTDIKDPVAGVEDRLHNLASGIADSKLPELTIRDYNAGVYNMAGKTAGYIGRLSGSSIKMAWSAGWDKGRIIRVVH